MVTENVMILVVIMAIDSGDSECDDIGCNHGN